MGTSQGDRTLTGAESALVRKSVGHLRDMITAGLDLDESYRSEVDVFDRLQPTQQLSILHEVAHGLLDPQTPILELTAVREGTVHAIYREIFSLVEIEIDLAQHREIDFHEFLEVAEPVFTPLKNLAHQIRFNHRLRLARTQSAISRMESGRLNSRRTKSTECS